MSVFRVITRIIPLNSSESSFEPASFDQLIDGNVGEVKVLNLTEPQSGMKYRIERIEYVQNAGPGETVESINNSFAEKLKTIPGFVQLKAGDIPLNPYDKSFQLTLPTVLFGNRSDGSNNDSQQRKNSESFKISVVKNFNFKKASPKKKAISPVISDKSGKKEIDYNIRLKSPPKSLSSKKKTVISVISDKSMKEEMNSGYKLKSPPKSLSFKKKPVISVISDKLRKEEMNLDNNLKLLSKSLCLKKVDTSAISDESENEEMNSNYKLKSLPKSANDSKALFKSKYQSYLSKKLKKTVWKKKSKSPQKLKSPKHSKSKSINGFSLECVTNGERKQNPNNPPSSHMTADTDLDARKTLDKILDRYTKEENTVENHNGINAKKRKMSITDEDDEDTDFSDNSLDSESGTLVINMPEVKVADTSDKSSNESAESELLNSNLQTGHRSSTSEDSLLDSFDSSNQNENSQVFQDSKNKEPGDDTICKKYVIDEGHPAHDLLVALKKYFLNGECLICGFIPADKDCNACEHMESHVLCNSFASSYKCSCCDDSMKFPDPRNLYMHALSREKTYNYICSICTLKFKRRHYLLRHTSKSH